MAVQQEVAVAAQHPTETWSALIASVTAIVALVGVLYSRLNNDNRMVSDKQQHDNDLANKRLDNGQDSFIEIGNKLVGIGEKIINIEQAGRFADIELDRLELDIKSLHTRLLIVETEHKRCAELLGGWRHE